MTKGTPASDITCPRCGWRNDASARMCGGCGQPLPPAATSYPDPGTATLPGVTPYVSPGDDSPTAIAPQHPSPAPPPDVAPHPAYRAGATPAWPAARERAPYASSTRRDPSTAPVKRRGNCLVRALVTLLVVVLVLGCLGVGAWTLLIRPPLHATMDGGIRSTVGAVVLAANDALAQLPPGEGGSTQVPATQLNDQLQSHFPAALPVRDVALDFASGGVIVRYSLAGRAGFFYVGLGARGGRLVARTASVAGPLKLIESSSELLQAVQTQLAGLTSSVAITRVSTADHTLEIAVRASGG